MENRITATIPFDYKGERFSPSAEINLDDIMSREMDISGIYLSVANHNQIGLYSYEYEVLLSSEIIFSNPQGIAQKFTRDGRFDLGQFRVEYHQEMALEELATIARKHLEVDNLNERPDLKAALLDAFIYGRSLSDKS